MCLSVLYASAGCLQCVTDSRMTQCRGKICPTARTVNMSAYESYMSAFRSDRRTSVVRSPKSCRQGSPRLIMCVARRISFSLRPSVGGCAAMNLALSVCRTVSSGTCNTERSVDECQVGAVHSPGPCAGCAGQQWAGQCCHSCKCCSTGSSCPLSALRMSALHQTPAGKASPLVNSADLHSCTARRAWRCSVPMLISGYRLTSLSFSLRS